LIAHPGDLLLSSYVSRGFDYATVRDELAAVMVMFGPAWIVDGFRIKARVNSMVGYVIAMLVLTIAAVAIAAAWAYVLGT
jgi:hypothetical protein